MLDFVEEGTGLTRTEPYQLPCPIRPCLRSGLAVLPLLVL